jgi:glycogen debranching enzyme
MADVFDETDTARLCRERREELAAEIEAAFWMEEEGLYGDVVAAPRVMAPRFQSWIERVTVEGGEPGILAELQDLLRQAQTDPHPDRLRPWLLKSWTILCPLEASLAPPERAQRVLARMESPEFTTSWGPYVNAVFRQASMSVNAGVAAMAEITYGRPEAGVRCISRVAEGLPCYMPGAIAEITPDGGCAVQAWSGYALAWPLVSGVFGLRPDAHGRRLEVRPSFPAGWTRAALRRLRIGNALFDVVWDVSKVDSASGDVSDDARRSGLSVTCSEPGWTIIT